MFAAIRAARSDSQLCETLSNTPDQSQNDQQDNRADEGVDDCVGKFVTPYRKFTVCQC
jgi:hypothetical protein